jgi:hypothetical protein
MLRVERGNLNGNNYVAHGVLLWVGITLNRFASLGVIHIEHFVFGYL